MNSVRKVRVVNGRFSSRYVVRGFGFCDLNSPDISRRVRITIFFPMLGVFICVLQQNEEVILPIMVTNMLQRCLEFIFALPPNVYWGVVFAVISNHDTEKGCCVRDGWKSAAADDTYGYDYA